MIEIWLEQASSYAADIDGLAMLILILVGFWFFVAQGVFFFLILRYQARPGVKALYVTGERKEEKRPINIAHALVILCDIVIIAGAINVWVDVKQTLPEPDSEIRITGQQWAWIFQHPGPDNELDTADDIRTVDELHVEVDKTYHFRLEARDVVHSFSVPVFRLKQDAIPGREIIGWFKPIQTGEHDIQCAEMCGIGHGVMGARIHIETATTHARWVRSHGETALAAAEDR